MDQLVERFGRPNVAGFESLGRYDGCYIVRLPGLHFSDVASLPDIRGLKKADVQYGYVPTEKAAGFWGKLNTGPVMPLVLLSYLRIRDDLTCRFGKHLHEGSVAPFLVERAEKVGHSLVIRSLGWPDYIVVVCGEDCSSIIDFTERDLWGATFADVLPALKKLADTTPTGRNDVANKPLFSRFYTLLGYPSAAHLRHVRGTIQTPQIYLRLRPGGQHRLSAAIGRAVDEWRRTHPELSLQAIPHSQLGVDDVLIELFIDDGGHRTGSFEAGPLLAWYREHFLADPGIPPEGASPTDPSPAETCITDIATTSEFRISSGSQGMDSDVIPLFDSYAGPALGDPEPLIERINEHAPLIGQPVSSAMRSLVYTLNWAMANEGVHRDLVDVALSTDAFRRYLEVELDRERVDGSLLQDIGNHTTAASQAVAQRLAGSYYDLAADAPEIVVEHNAGIQKVLAALYAIQRQWFIGAHRGFGTESPDIKAYWLIAPEGSPATSIRRGASLALLLCSSLTFDPTRAHPEIVHELTHVLWDEWTKLPIASEFLGLLKELFGVEQAPPIGGAQPAGPWQWMEGIPGLSGAIEVVRSPGPFDVAVPDVLLMVHERCTRKRWPKRLIDEVYYLAQRSNGNSPDESEGLVRPLPDYDGSLVRTVFHLLGEALAEVMSFIFSHNGDIARYRSATLELLPRAEYLRVPVFTTWVVENMAAFLWAKHGWDPATADMPLTEFLFGKQLADLEHEFYVWLAGKNSLDSCPLRAVDLAAPVAARWEEGWGDLQKSLFEDSGDYEQIRRCVGYLTLHARILALLDTVEPEFRKALTALASLGRDGAAEFEPRALEDLWHEAVTHLAPP